MIRSYLTTAWRNVVRQPGFTLINVCGLAIGLATSILILRYVQDEFNFDTWHSKGDRIYRVLRETRSASASGFSGGLSGELNDHERLSTGVIYQQINLTCRRAREGRVITA